MTLADKIRAMAIADPHGAHDVWNAALDRAADLAEQHQADADAQDWQSDPAANPAWNAGCDFAMTAICKMLKVDPHSISWDAATEELEGDVMSVIGNIMMAAFGDDWQDAILADAALDRIKAEAHRAGMREAAGICERIRIAIANGPMPEGARFDYEQTILAAAENGGQHD